MVRLLAISTMVLKVPQKMLEVMRASGKGFDIFVTIHGVGTEQPPEEENLLDDERPHAETSGFVLLLGRLELVQVVGHYVRDQTTSSSLARSGTASVLGAVDSSSPYG